MASHGGIAGVTIFASWYARRHGDSWCAVGAIRSRRPGRRRRPGDSPTSSMGKLYGNPADPKKAPWCDVGSRTDDRRRVFPVCRQRRSPRSFPGMLIGDPVGASVHDPAVRRALQTNADPAPSLPDLPRRSVEGLSSLPHPLRTALEVSPPAGWGSWHRDRSSSSTRRSASSGKCGAGRIPGSSCGFRRGKF